MSNKIIRLQELNKYNEKIKEYIKEKIGENKPIRTAATVESLTSWQGTPLPNESDAYIDKVYLNKELSIEEVKNILATLTWPITAVDYGLTNFKNSLVHPVMIVPYGGTEEYTPDQIVCLKKGNDYAILMRSTKEVIKGNITSHESKNDLLFTTIATFDSAINQGFTGWNPSIDSPLVVEKIIS